MKIQLKPAEELFKQYCVAYKKRDLATLLNLMTEDCNMWGTGLDEYRVGLKQAEAQFLRDWSECDACEVDIISFVPTPVNALWAAAVCNVRLTVAGKEHVIEHLRGTIIIENKAGIWKIAHIHTSFPDYRNAANHSFHVTIGSNAAIGTEKNNQQIAQLTQQLHALAETNAQLQTDLAQAKATIEVKDKIISQLTQQSAQDILTNSRYKTNTNVLFPQPQHTLATPHQDDINNNNYNRRP